MADLQTKYDEYFIKYGSPPNATQFRKYARIKYSEASKFLKTAVPMNTMRNRSISTKTSDPTRNISLQTRITSKSMITNQTKPKPKPKPKTKPTKPSQTRSNPYLDSSLTSKFMSPKENQQFIKKHSKPPIISTANAPEQNKYHQINCQCTKYSESTLKCNHSQQKHFAKNGNVANITPKPIQNQDEFVGRNRSDSVRINNNDINSVNIQTNDGYNGRTRSRSVRIDITPPNISSVIGSSNPYIDCSIVFDTKDDEKKMSIKKRLSVEIDGGRTRSESVRTTNDAEISFTRTKSNSVPFNDANQQMIEQCMDPKVKQFIDIAKGQKTNTEEQKTTGQIDDRSEYDDNMGTVIIDNGSETIKMGFGGSGDIHKPSHIFESVIGYDNMDSNDLLFGDKINAKHRRDSMFNIKKVINRGNVSNWEYMEKILEYGFNDKLLISSWNSNVLLTESVLRCDSEREKSVQVLFESFDVNSMYLQNEACLSLYGTGQMSGTVLGIGYGVTYSASIFEGFCIPKSVIKINSAGYDLTKYLTERLMNINKNTRKYEYIMNDIKHKNNNEGIEYILPDGQHIMIDKERYDCCSQLFGGFMNLNNETKWKQNKISLSNKCGIQHMMYESIKCVNDELYSSNIVLSGGSSLFDGLAKRLREETLSLMDNNNILINIIANDKRQYLSWIGGSIISSIPQFKENFIQRNEYQENGKSIVHRKCPS